MTDNILPSVYSFKMCDLSNMETVKEFYGQTVQHVDDFKVKMCRLNKSGRTKEIVEAEKLVHPKVKDKYVKY